ncbi:carboxypeptidase regulatory-like domain-containing protein [bacterium]|nr:carboxypeptidase regulatory-like domain-containing protein [candidate division CSSED10-310 bacterium]
MSLPKHSFRFLFCFLLCLSLAACDRQWTGDIKGQLTDEETSEPIPDAIVTAKSMKNEYAISTISDSSGNYRITDARWGPNEVSVYHPNYQAITRYADVIRDKSVELDFDMTRIPDSVTPEITVWITNDSDIGIANARVDLYRKESRSYDLYTYLGTQVTGYDGYATFMVSDIEEDQIQFFRLKVAALGFANTVKDFSISWFNPNITVHIIMEPV